MSESVHRGVLLLIGFLGSLLLLGCGDAYVVRGKVVEADMSSMWFVESADQEFDEPGVSNATISVYRDGGRPNQRLIATGRSDGAGEFAIPLEGGDGFGAGWMIERWLIQVTRPGYQTAEALIELPEKRADKRLLVLMAPGYSPPSRETESLWDEYERFK